MNQLQQVFDYGEAQVRTVVKDGQPWFVAKDVCEVLEIEKHRDAVSRLNEKQRGSAVVDTLGGPQEMATINEAGLYKLVFSSRKPEAEKFTDWISENVLPSIRKTGAYIPEQLSPQLQLLINMELKQKQLEDKQSALEQTITMVKDTLLHRDEDWRKWLNITINNTVKAGAGDYRSVRSDGYKKLEERGKCNLSIRLGNLKDRLREQRASKTKIEAVNKLDVIEADIRLKEIYTSIVKELAISSGT